MSDEISEVGQGDQPQADAAGDAPELVYSTDEHSQQHSAVAEVRGSYDTRQQPHKDVYGRKWDAVSGLQKADADNVTSSKAARSDTIAGKHGGTLTPFNAERAAAAVQARERKRRRITAEALVRAAGQVPAFEGRVDLTYWDMYGYAMEQHSMNMADPSAPGSAQSLKHIDGVLFPKPERSQDAVPAGGMTVTLSSELAREWLAARRQRGE